MTHGFFESREDINGQMSPVFMTVKHTTSVFHMFVFSVQLLFQGIKISNPAWPNVSAAHRQDEDQGKRPKPTDTKAGSTVMQATAFGIKAV